MHTARRIYLYLVAFISLQMLLAGASNLLSLLTEIAFDLPQPLYTSERYIRDQVSLWGAVLLVGTAVWAIHWLLIRRVVAADPTGEERRTVWRKLFLYATLLVASVRIFFAAFDLVRALAGDAGDLLQRQLVSNAAPALVVYGVAWFYHWTVRRDDLAHAPETGAGATVARWYLYLVNYGALTGLIWGLSDLARQGWRAITASDGTAILVGTGLSARLPAALGFIVAGLLIWLPHWSLAQHQLATQEAERRSVLRKVYLYALIGQTVGVALTNLAFFGYNTLRMLIGTDPLVGSGDRPLTAAGLPLLTALVYGVFWAYHRHILGRDMLLLPNEGEQQATIRRIYAYLLALIGLALMASGLADMLRLVIDLALGGRATTNLSGRAWGDEISLFATGVVVGGLVWAAHWLAAQRAALAADGEVERQALVRRIYLFLILFAGVVALLVSGAILLYRLLRSLGIGLTGDDRSDLSWALGVAIVAGGTVAYHLRVLLDDQRRRAGEGLAASPAAPVAAPTAARLILLSDATPAGLESAIAGLRAALPESATLETFAAEGATATDLRSWLAERERHAEGPTGAPAPATA